jgi:hypothetical protein
VASRSELIIEWARGWSVSRGTPPPTAAGRGVRIALRQPSGAVRYVLPIFDRIQLAQLADRLTTVGSEIKVFGSSNALRTVLDGDWTSYAACELMTTPFARSQVILPDGYTSRIARDGVVAVAVVLSPDGEIVSSGRLAPVGRYGVVDQVETQAPHRRHGLGTAVMALLCNRAVDTRMRSGLLSATTEGQTLYHRLNWITHGEVAGVTRTRSTRTQLT